jgi:hypothetical protein
LEKTKCGRGFCFITPTSDDEKTTKPLSFSLGVMTAFFRLAGLHIPGKRALYLISGFNLTAGDFSIAFSDALRGVFFAGTVDALAKRGDSLTRRDILIGMGDGSGLSTKDASLVRGHASFHPVPDLLVESGRLLPLGGSPGTGRGDDLRRSGVSSSSTGDSSSPTRVRGVAYTSIWEVSPPPIAKRGVAYGGESSWGSTRGVAYTSGDISDNKGVAFWDVSPILGKGCVVCSTSFTALVIRGVASHGVASLAKRAWDVGVALTGVVASWDVGVTLAGVVATWDVGVALAGIVASWDAGVVPTGPPAPDSEGVSPQTAGEVCGGVSASTSLVNGVGVGCASPSPDEGSLSTPPANGDMSSPTSIVSGGASCCDASVTSASSAHTEGVAVEGVLPSSAFMLPC